MKNNRTGTKIAVMSYNNVFLEVVLRYFQLDSEVHDSENFYYVRPINTDSENNTSLVPAFRDTTEFFFPRFHIDVSISNDKDPKFAVGDEGFVAASIPFDLKQSYLNVNSYLLLANKITSVLPVSYRMTINISNALKIITDMSVKCEGEYIVLRDSFDQFDQFKLDIGYLYTESEYRELSYRKLMGITANTVYLQNATSTEKLAWIVARLNMHFPEVGKDDSTWDYIKQLVGDKESLDAIYQLLYHKYPYGPSAPLCKKAKIEF